MERLNVRMGVHTGETACGNIGCSARLKYGILGPNSDIASVLEDANKHYGTSVLISQSTCLEPDVQELFVLRPVDLLSPEGTSLENEVWLYEVLSVRLKKNLNIFLNVFSTSFFTSIKIVILY